MGPARRAIPTLFTKRPERRKYHPFLPTLCSTPPILDDPLVFDSCPSFDGGVVSNRRANLLAVNQLASLINGDITRTGQIITRRGTRRLGSGAVANGSALPIQGLTYYDAPSGGYLVAAAGGSLWRLDSHADTGGNWSPLVSTVDGTLPPWRAVDAAAPVAFAQGADCLFFTDGNGSIHGWNGTIYQDLGSVSADPNLRPPVGHLLAWHASRLCVAGVAAVPDAIYFSDPLLTAPVPGDPPWNNTTGHVRAGRRRGRRHRGARAVERFQPRRAQAPQRLDRQRGRPRAARRPRSPSTRSIAASAASPGGPPCRSARTCGFSPATACAACAAPRRRPRSRRFPKRSRFPSRTSSSGSTRRRSARVARRAGAAGICSPSRWTARARPTPCWSATR